MAVVVSPCTSTAAGRSAVEHVAQAEQDARGDVEEILVRLHHRQVVIGDDGEQRQHLVEHLAMLAGDADARRQASATRAARRSPAPA